MAEEVLAKGNRTCSIICRFKKSWRCREQSAVAEFVLNMTEHENANVRKQAALDIGSEWAMGIDGMGCHSQTDGG